MKLKDLGEFDLIKRIAGRVRLSGRVLKGIGDDAAVLEYKKDGYLLFTSDMLVEGRHFHKSSGAYLVGKKSLSVNISDIAAMGGTPFCALISLGAPSSLDVGFVDDLYKGIRAAAKKFNVDLAGGDTVNSEKIVINIALLGEVKKSNLVLRSGAKEGDDIFITGSIGGSSKGGHLDFIPRLKEAGFLAGNFKINSMIDVSDGLLADLGHILKASGKGAFIYEKDIPVSKKAEDFKSAMSEGEDFELVFTLAKNKSAELMKIWPFKTRLSKIGEIQKKGQGFFLIRKDGRKEKPEVKGYAHF
jgi:thiamine-monophosphate kinase